MNSFNCLIITKDLENPSNLVTGISASQIQTISYNDSIEDAYLNIFPDIVVMEYVDGQDYTNINQHLRHFDESRRVGLLLITPNTIKSKDNVVLFKSGFDDIVFDTMSKEEFEIRTLNIIRYKKSMDALRMANYQLRMAAETDELTGLLNMRGFPNNIKKEKEKEKMQMSGFALFMMDLDNFKSVNDTTDHMMGSHCISEVGTIISSQDFMKKPKGFGARYGGDEYIGMFYCDSEEQMEEYVKKLQDDIRKETFKYDKFSLNLTPSIGIVWVEPNNYDGDLDSVIKAADTLLYKSKDNGRNQYTIGIFSSEKKNK